MKNWILYIRKWIAIITFVICMFAVVLCDGSHHCKDGWFWATSFSISNMMPPLWAAPISCFSALFFPWVYTDSKHSAFMWSIYPTDNRIISKIVGILATVFNLAITIPAVYLTILLGLETDGWFREDEITGIYFIYLFFAFVFFVVNLTVLSICNRD